MTKRIALALVAALALGGCSSVAISDIATDKVRVRSSWENDPKVMQEADSRLRHLQSQADGGLQAAHSDRPLYGRV